jgi:hypothetical protein
MEVAVRTLVSECRENIVKSDYTARGGQRSDILSAETDVQFTLIPGTAVILGL